MLSSHSHHFLIPPTPLTPGGCQEGVNDTQALATAQAFKETILEYDTTRPVSGAWNAQLDSLLWGWGPKVMDVQVGGCADDGARKSDGELE